MTRRHHRYTPPVLPPCVQPELLAKFRKFQGRTVVPPEFLAAISQIAAKRLVKPPIPEGLKKKKLEILASGKIEAGIGIDLEKSRLRHCRFVVPVLRDDHDGGLGRARGRHREAQEFEAPFRVASGFPSFRAHSGTGDRRAFRNSLHRAARNSFIARLL